MKVKLGRVIGASAVVLAFSTPLFSATAASATTNPRSNGIVYSTEYYSHTYGELVTLTGYGYHKADMVNWWISDRTSGVTVKSGTLKWFFGLEVGRANGLPVGKYLLKYTHVNGTYGTEYFAVTDGVNG